MNSAPVCVDSIKLGSRSMSAPDVHTRGRFSDYVMIFKPRLSALVLLTTVVGYYFGTVGEMNVWRLLELLLGTALVAMGSGALNQVLERESDKRMARTAGRPLPAGRLQHSEVLYFGVATAVIGIVYLWVRVGEQPALWAALTLALYVFVYTPLKPFSSLNTLVGALPGALPPLIGFSAARGQLDPRAWALFALIFVWQLPHFLSIAWLYRAEYKRAGLRMLPNDDPDGFRTALQMTVHALTLLPLSMVPLFLRMAGGLYLISALSLGLFFLGACGLFLVKRNDWAARKVFLASVIYLPLLLSLMMFDSRM